MRLQSTTGGRARRGLSLWRGGLPRRYAGDVLVAVFAVGCVAASIRGGAQDSAPAIHGGPPPSAASVAAKVDGFYNNLRSLRAAFTETYRAPGTDKVESGVLMLARPGRMRWDYDSPAGKVFLVDGRDAWFYAPGSGEAQKMPVKKLDDLRTPLRFLLGKAHLEKELDGLTVADVNGVTRLRGAPKFQAGGGAAQVTAVSLDVLPSGEITRIESSQADGTIITIVLGSQQQNVALTANVFQFAPPPGVKVVEGAGVF